MGWNLVKLTRTGTNRVITLRADTLTDLDNWTSQLLDIIDSYGGTNPYPRFFISGDSFFYSCTTKIANLNAEDFDKELKEFLK